MPAISNQLLVVNKRDYAGLTPISWNSPVPLGDVELFTLNARPFAGWLALCFERQ